ncbi:hypothetical protein EDB83DRAFT_2319990 [Lactarius deliciosus]|nr:hypothetical protein EDB83DRAFT_2319990 [Lactarius deliciosus]
MSQTPAITTSSSNFRAIFVATLKAYEKKTKTVLLTHPLATQLQSCDSSSDVLAVLHNKANEFDQSRSQNGRLLSWLNSTINVLYASSTLGEAVGLIFSPAKVISHSHLSRFSRKNSQARQALVKSATEVERPLGAHVPGKA